MGSRMKKEILIGWVVGIISNTLGVLVCILIIASVKRLPFIETWSFYQRSGSLWMILSLGALPNLLAFFGFLKINRDYRARGVLLATFMTAIIAYLIYFL